MSPHACWTGGPIRVQNGIPPGLIPASAGSITLFMSVSPVRTTSLIEAQIGPRKSLTEFQKVSHELLAGGAPVSIAVLVSVIPPVTTPLIAAQIGAT